MAGRSGLSERSFLRRFRRATGQSPVQYIQTLRVEEAKQMLETTDTPIDQIATEIGYSEPSSFRSAFRKLVGLPASEYRKKWRGAHTRQITMS
jgi:transcriptional regulator GlxA family with amidase domain